MYKSKNTLNYEGNRHSSNKQKTYLLNGEEEIKFIPNPSAGIGFFNSTTAAGQAATSGTTGGMGEELENTEKEKKMDKKQIKKVLNKIDNSCIDRRLKYYNLTGLYESANLSKKDEEDLGKVLYELKDQDKVSEKDTEKLHDMLKYRENDLNEFMDIDLGIDARGQSVGMFNGQGGEVHNEDLTEFFNVGVDIDARGQSVGLMGGTGGTVTNQMGNESLEEELVFDNEHIKAELEKTVRESLKRKLGYDDDFLNNYVFVDVEDAEFSDGSPAIKAEIRWEIGYEEGLPVVEDLDEVIRKYDPQSYFEHEYATVLNAYIRKDQSDDVVDEDVVKDYVDLFDSASTKDEFIEVYLKAREETENDSMSFATFEKIMDFAETKFNEIEGLKESLMEAGFLKGVKDKLANSAVGKAAKKVGNWLATNTITGGVIAGAYETAKAVKNSLQDIKNEIKTENDKNKFVRDSENKLKELNASVSDEEKNYAQRIQQKRQQANVLGKYSKTQMEQKDGDGGLKRGYIDKNGKIVPMRADPQSTDVKSEVEILRELRKRPDQSDKTFIIYSQEEGEQPKIIYSSANDFDEKAYKQNLSKLKDDIEETQKSLETVKNASVDDIKTGKVQLASANESLEESYNSYNLMTIGDIREGSIGNLSDEEIDLDDKIFRTIGRYFHKNPDDVYVIVADGEEVEDPKEYNDVFDSYSDSNLFGQRMKDYDIRVLHIDLNDKKYEVIREVRNGRVFLLYFEDDYSANDFLDEMKAEIKAFYGESLNEADEDEKPFSRKEVERELREITDNFTKESGEVRCGFEEERDNGREILKGHYKTVEVSVDDRKPGGPWYVIAFAHPFVEESLDESAELQELEQSLLGKEFDKEEVFAKLRETFNDHAISHMHPEMRVTLGLSYLIEDQTGENVLGVEWEEKDGKIVVTYIDFIDEDEVVDDDNDTLDESKYDDLWSPGYRVYWDTKDGDGDEMEFDTEEEARKKFDELEEDESIEWAQLVRLWENAKYRSPEPDEEIDEFNRRGW